MGYSRVYSRPATCWPSGHPALRRMFSRGVGRPDIGVRGHPACTPSPDSVTPLELPLGGDRYAGEGRELDRLRGCPPHVSLHRESDHCRCGARQECQGWSSITHLAHNIGFCSSDGFQPLIPQNGRLFGDAIKVSIILKSAVS